MRHHSPRGKYKKKKKRRKKEGKEDYHGKDEGGLSGANIARFGLVNGAIISYIHFMPFMIEVKVKDRQEQNRGCQQEFCPYVPLVEADNNAGLRRQRTQGSQADTGEA